MRSIHHIQIVAMAIGMSIACWVVAQASNPVIMGVVRNAQGQAVANAKVQYAIGTPQTGLTIGSVDTMANGEFTQIGGHAHYHFARLDEDGNPDARYSLFANNTVTALALRNDGMLAVSGRFTLPRNYFARIIPPAPPRQGVMLMDGAVHWVRIDESPELTADARLEFSLDGENYAELGTMLRTKFGWELAVSIDFTQEESVYLRAADRHKRAG